MDRMVMPRLFEQFDFSPLFLYTGERRWLWVWVIKIQLHFSGDILASADSQLYFTGDILASVDSQLHFTGDILASVDSQLHFTGDSLVSVDSRTVRWSLKRPSLWSDWR